MFYEKMSIYRNWASFPTPENNH